MKQELADLKAYDLDNFERCFTVQGTMPDLRLLNPALDTNRACTPGHAARPMGAVNKCSPDHHVIVDTTNRSSFGQPELARMTERA